MHINTDSLGQAGFTGFLSIQQLWKDHSPVPAQRGVYTVLNPDCNKNQFLANGVGGFFKERNPNVATALLQQKWIHNCPVVYIGQAGGNASSATLRGRIKQLLDFGKGKPVGHYGGRYLWQIAHHPELLVAWKASPDQDPREAEKELMQEFMGYYGKLPFANLTM